MSKNLKIRIEGYRCFTRENPLEFELTLPFLAFVGPNNVGKSTVLLAFHELEPLFSVLGNVRGLFLEYAICRTKFGGVSGNISRIVSRGGTGEIRVTITLPEANPILISNESIEAPTAFRELQFVLAANSENWLANSISDYKVNALSALFPSDSETNVYYEPSESAFRIKVRHAFGEPTSVYTAELKLALEALAPLRSAAYCGAFRNLSHLQNGSDRSFPTGRQFAVQWNSATTQEQGLGPEEKCIQVERTVARLFGFESFRLKFKNSESSLLATIGETTYGLDELGSGVSEAVYLLGNVALRSPKLSLLLLDEPELHLHPAKQQELLLQLRSLVSHGVVFATHSIGLARQVAPKIYALSRGERGPIITDLTGIDPRASNQALADLASEMGISLIQAAGYKNILLVEGPNDIGSALAWLRILEKDKSTIVMHGGGTALLRLEPYKELERFGMTVYLLIDSEDGNSNTNTVAQRKGLPAMLASLPFVKVCVTARRAFENYFTQSALDATFGAGNAKSLGKLEDPKKTSGWTKDDGASIAAAMTKAEILDADNDVGLFLDSIPA